MNNEKNHSILDDGIMDDIMMIYNDMNARSAEIASTSSATPSFSAVGGKHSFVLKLFIGIAASIVLALNIGTVTMLFDINDSATINTTNYILNKI